MALYLDSSAFVKLVVEEPASTALRRELRRHRAAPVASALLRAEALRACRRHGPDAIAVARAALRRIDLIAVSDNVLEAAGTLEPGVLRTLDAIHLATALSLGDDLEAVVTYDRRMADGAELLGIAVLAPV